MKRFTVLTIAIVMSVLFAACRDNNNSNVPAKQTTQSSKESTTSTKSTKENTTSTNNTRESTTSTNSTRENTTKSTSAESTEKATSTSESPTAVESTNETIFNETGSDLDDLFEEGTVSNGSGEGVIDQIGDDITR